MGYCTLYEINTLEILRIRSRERIGNAVTQLQNGKGILLIDDKNRENEGDLVLHKAKPCNNITRF